MQLAIRACSEALSVPHQSENVSSKVSSILTHWQALSDSKQPHSTFEDEINAPLPNLFDKYMNDSNQMLKINWDEIDEPEKDGDLQAKTAETDIVADYRRKLKLSSMDMTGVESEDLKSLHTIEDIEMHLSTKRRWQILKEGIKGLARESLRASLITCFQKNAGKMERDCGDDNILDIVTLGYNCASENNGGPNDTTQLIIGACLLLAKAYDFDYLDIVKKRNPDDPDVLARAEARLWKTRAICHWRVYEKQGLGSGKGEKAHLENCMLAWDQALKHMAIAGDPLNWVLYAKAAACKGDYQVAANSYGTVLRSFRIKGIQNVAIMCSSLLKALGNYDQAVAYLFSAISMNMEPPYDSIDMAFMMARLHEEYAFHVQTKANEATEGGKAEPPEIANNNMNISRTAYSAVFQQLQDLDDGPKHENVVGWLSDHKTWLKYGDQCATAGHHIFAADMYEQSIRRLRDLDDHPDKSKITLKLAKSLRKCGQNEKALDVIGAAVVFERNEGIKAKINLLKKAWMQTSEQQGNRRAKRQTFSPDGQMLFKIALMLPMLDVMDQFIPKPEPREPDLELAKIRAARELKQKNGKWKHLRRRLKESARIEFAKQVVEEIHALPSTSVKKGIMKGTVTDFEKEDLKNATGKEGYANTSMSLAKLAKLTPNELKARDEVTVALNMIVTMGKLCHDSSGASNAMHRCAAVMMQRAVDCGYVGDGNFYRKLASSHFKAYLSGGVLGERAHLQLASDSWDKAFEHLENASKVECWIEATEVRVHNGDLDRAAQTLGVLVHSFPKYKGLASISILSCSILLKMGHFEQARAYMYDAMSRGAPTPYTQTDLTFFMGRVYERWSEEVSEAEGVNDTDRKNLRKTAGDAYFAVYKNLKQTNNPLVIDNGVTKSFNVFLTSATTWRWFAEKACLGNHFILGGMLYEQGVRRDSTLVGKELRALLCFGAAKCCARSGDMEYARVWLKHGLEGTVEYCQHLKAKDQMQMQAVLEAWENPTSKFAEDMLTPVPRLLSSYALISPSAATTPMGTPRTVRGDDMTPRTGNATPRTPRGDIDNLLSTPVPQYVTDNEVSQRWSRIRKAVKGKALATMVDDVKSAKGADVPDLVRRIGYVLVSDQSIVSSAILQSLADKGHLGADPAKFCQKLAEAHTNAWFETKGLGASRLNLVMAQEGWRKALTHLSVASQPVAWAWSVAVNTSLGNWEESSAQLGTLIRSFPQIHADPLAVIAMSASSILAGLRNYEQACAYLYDSIEKGPPHPFNEGDMAFFMARLNDRWGGGEGAREAFEVQREALARGAKVAKVETPKKKKVRMIGDPVEEEEGGGEGEDVEMVPTMMDDDGVPVPLPGTAECITMTKRRENATKAYSHVFASFKQMEGEGVSEKQAVRMMNSKEHSTAKSWLSDSRTWLAYAELAELGNMPVLATDMMTKACAQNNVTKKLWIKRARCCRMVGDMVNVDESLKEALQFGGASNSDVLQRLSEEERGVLKAENKKIRKLKKMWFEDEAEMVGWVKKEEGGEVVGPMRTMLKLGLKELVLSKVKLQENSTSANPPKVGEEVKVKVKPRLLKRKAEAWRVQRRDAARLLLWQWLKVGVKNAARARVLERLGGVEGGGCKGGDLACVGMLCLKSSLRRAGCLMLERAKKEGFVGVDVPPVIRVVKEDGDEEKGAAEKGGVKEEEEEKKTEDVVVPPATSELVGTMIKGITKARLTRALEAAHADLAREGAERFHSNKSLDMAKEALECKENSMSPLSWIALLRSQVRCGLLSEAMDTSKSFQKLKGNNDYVSHACITNASLLLTFGGENKAELALESIRMAMEIEAEGTRKCGLMRKEVAFLFAWCVKRSNDAKLAKTMGLSNSDYEGFLGVFEDKAMLLYEGVWQEENRLGLIPTGSKPSSAKKKKLNFAEKLSRESTPEAGIRQKSREEELEPVRDWLGDYQTWLRLGVRCVTACQPLFACLFFRHAYNMVVDPEAKAAANDKVKSARLAVLAYCRVGRFDFADKFVSQHVPDSFKEILRVFLHESGEVEAEKARVKFETDLGGEVDDMLGLGGGEGDAHAPKALAAVPCRLPMRPGQMIDKWKLQDENNERRWKVLKKGMRPAARALAIQQVLLNQQDTQQLATLGILCTSSSKTDTAAERCACLLMQRAADGGYKGDSKFWKRLAMCHMSLWKGTSQGRGGGGGERGHLVRADKAFDEALKHLENASNIEMWVQAAEVKLCLGEYVKAAMCLGTLLRQLGGNALESKIPKIGEVSLSVVELNMELGKFDQAEAYLYSSMVRIAPTPLTKLDLLFYMARLHGKWADSLFDVGVDVLAEETAEEKGVRENSIVQHRETSQASYAQVFRQCVEAGGTNGADSGISTAEDWLSNWTPWCAFAERAALARHYLLAADMYSEGLRRDEAASTTRVAPWFSLAKAYRRCGRLDESLAAARKAVEIYYDRGEVGKADGLTASQMETAIDAWEHDQLSGGITPRGYEAEIKQPVAHW